MCRLAGQTRGKGKTNCKVAEDGEKRVGGVGRIKGWGREKQLKKIGSHFGGANAAANQRRMSKGRHSARRHGQLQENAVGRLISCVALTEYTRWGSERDGRRAQAQNTVGWQRASWQRCPRCAHTARHLRRRIKAGKQPADAAGRWAHALVAAGASPRFFCRYSASAFFVMAPSLWLPSTSAPSLNRMKQGRP